MRLIVSSTQDEASKNILSKLIESDWQECDRWSGNPVYERKDDIVVTIDERHIYFDDIDKKIGRYTGLEFDEVVYVSKHSSEAGVDSLTVHPIGNFGEAKYGGKEGKLVPASPHSMTHAFHLLRKKAKKENIQSEYKISFEATHHGPFLETPTYYIEIGSDLDSWKDQSAAKVIAETVKGVKREGDEDEPVAICIGGGHYTPRFTELVKNRKVALGHIVPGWGMKYLNRNSFSEAVEKTPDLEYVYFDRSDTSANERKKVTTWAKEEGLDIIRSKDLEKR
ncbi:MAG: D-aminoacyl-tRNA deacylase [Candidatus Natronoplasma sp.]